MNSAVPAEQLAAFRTIFKASYNLMQTKCGEVPFRDCLKEERFFRLLFAASISHNINRDFLCSVFIPRLLAETGMVLSGSPLLIFAALVLRCCEGYEHEEKYDCERRSVMLNSILGDLYCNRTTFENILSIRMLYGKNGHVSILKRIRVFSEDPLGKKLHLLIQLFSRAQLIQVRDLYRLKGAVDYHIIRVYNIL